MTQTVDSTNSSDDLGVRLHKSSPVFILLHVLIKSIVPMAFAVLTYGTSQYSNYIIIGAGFFIFAFSILQYWFYQYRIKPDKIEIKQGIMFKQNRKVPYTRIQNVNVSQNLLQRFFNVATLQLESASGGKPEAVMRVVDLAVVENIKERVKQANALAQQSKEDKVAEAIIDKPLLKLSTTDVIKYGIISQKGMFYGAILFGFLAQNQMLMAAVVKYFNLFYQLPDFTKITLRQGVEYVLVIGLLMFVFLQLMSILWALLKFYGFTLHKNNDRLQAKMGLLSTVAATIPLKKIQLLRIKANPLHKYFNARTISIETAGGVNTDKSGIVMRWLAPYIGKDTMADFMQKIEPKVPLASVDWQLIPQRAYKRVLKKSLFKLAAFSAILIGIATLPYFLFRFYIWIVIISMLPVIYFYAKNYVKKTAYFINDDIICFKSGVWFGQQSFVKISKIQTVELLQSPFNRHNKMATLQIDTAGSNPVLHHVRIPYLELADAYRLQSFIQKRMDTVAFNW